MEEQPFAQQSVSDIDDLATLNAALVGVYSNLQDLYQNSIAGMGELGTDVTHTTSSSGNYQTIDYYSYTPSSTPISTFWEVYFVVVRNANIVIDRADVLLQSGVISDEEWLNITSEARALRAFSYFKLMCTYGGVPLITERIYEIETDEFKYSRASINEMFEFLEEEFTFLADDETSGLITTKSGGVFNIWAAKALCAKFYLYVGTSILRDQNGTPSGGVQWSIDPTATLTDIPSGKTDLIPGYAEITMDPSEMFTAAQSQLQSIISDGGFELTSSYYDPFMVAKKNSNDESIWEIQFSTTTDYGSEWSKLFGVYSSVSQDYESSAVAGYVYIKPVAGFYKYFKIGDKRRDINVSTTSYSTQSDTDTDPIIRDDGAAFTDNNILSYSATHSVYDSGTNSYADVKVAGNLFYDTDEFLRYGYLATGMNTQMGTYKYGWGYGDDPTEWEEQTMMYNMTDCPNNAVIVRYADVLLMAAEIEMLLAGADPSQPTSTAGAANALQYVNKIVNRSLDSESITTYESTVNSGYASAYTALTAAEEAYNTESSSTNFSTKFLAQLAYDDYEYKSEDLEGTQERIFKEYTAETLTYEALIDERAKELCFEFGRWYDLQRLGWLEYKVLARRSYKAPPTIVTPKHYLYPIPLDNTDLTLNTDGFTQNPGYN